MKIVFIFCGIMIVLLLGKGCVQYDAYSLYDYEANHFEVQAQAAEIVFGVSDSYDRFYTLESDGVTKLILRIKDFNNNKTLKEYLVPIHSAVLLPDVSKKFALCQNESKFIYISFSGQLCCYSLDTGKNRVLYDRERLSHFYRFDDRTLLFFSVPSCILNQLDIENEVWQQHKLPFVIYRHDSFAFNQKYLVFANTPPFLLLDMESGTFSKVDCGIKETPLQVLITPQNFIVLAYPNKLVVVELTGKIIKEIPFDDARQKFNSMMLVTHDLALCKFRKGESYNSNNSYSFELINLSSGTVKHLYLPGHFEFIPVMNEPKLFLITNTVSLLRI